MLQIALFLALAGLIVGAARHALAIRDGAHARALDGGTTGELSRVMKIAAALSHYLIAIIAALTVPVFLSLTESGLLKEDEPSDLDIFIVFGLGLLAAWAGEQFLNSLSKRVIDQQQQRLRAMIAEQRARQRVIERLLIEPEPGMAVARAGASGDLDDLGDAERSVLLALVRGPWRVRRLEGVASSAGLRSPEEAMEVLVRLEAGGLAARSTELMADVPALWYATPAGIDLASGGG